jgi:hypothetical protein
MNNEERRWRRYDEYMNKEAVEMIRNPVTLEYLYKLHEQEVNKKWSYKYKQDQDIERHKVCVDLKIIKFCF